MRKQTITVQFRAYLTAALASGLGTINIQPSTFNQVGTVADAYALYRCRKLRYRSQPLASTATALQAIAYIPGAVDNPPATVASLAQVSTSVLISERATVPSNWVSLEYNQLRGYLEWYKTVVGSVDPVDEVQGAIFIFGTGTEIYRVEVEGEFEFRDLLPTSLTPMVRIPTSVLGQLQQLSGKQGSACAGNLSQSPTSRTGKSV